VDKRRKHPKPRSDLSPFWPGALVLNARAFEALGDFLGNFGQLLELDVDGHTEHFFNCTHLVPCIDVDKSEKRAAGTIGKEVFDVSRIPSAPAVFKEPLTARSRIYVNDAGRAELDKRIRASAVTGMSFRCAGA